MPRIKEFTFKKGYEKSGLSGQKVTWQNGTTIEEALGPNPTHPEQKPDFPSIESLLAYAYAQLDIRRGHAVKAELDAALEGDAEKKIAPRDLTLAEAEEIARKTTAGSTIRRAGTGAAAAKKKLDALTGGNALAQHDEEKLGALVTLGLITAEQRDAELKRRAESGNGEPSGKRRPAAAR